VTFDKTSMTYQNLNLSVRDLPDNHDPSDMVAAMTQAMDVTTPALGLLYREERPTLNEAMDEVDNDRVGYDAVIQAESGFMDLNGEKNGPPTKMPVALIDILAGHQLKEGLLLALLKRERSGEGSLVEVSLIHAAIASLANQATNWLVAGKRPSRQGSAHPNIAPYGESFETNDGKRILLAVGSDRQFYDLLHVLNIDPITFENKFSTNHRRIEHREELTEVLSERIIQFTSHELFLKIHKLKIPAGIIQNISDVFEMKEAKELMLANNGLTGVKTFVAKGSGFWILDSEFSLIPPPHFGEHTTEIQNGLK
jgi:crotonobetainyl-CoA:carnitine CoA-transferase CaiB-like acyl-CoA transferase